MRLSIMIVLGLCSLMVSACVDGQQASEDVDIPQTIIVDRSTVEKLPPSSSTGVDVNGYRCGWCWCDIEAGICGCEDCVYEP